MFNFDFCYGRLRYHPTNFDLKLCKLPTSERRAATTATETRPLCAPEACWGLMKSGTRAKFTEPENRFQSITCKTFE